MYLRFDVDVLEHAFFLWVVTFDLENAHLSLAFYNGDAFRNDYRQEQMFRDQRRMKLYHINANRFRDYNEKKYENPQWIPYRKPYKEDYLSSYDGRRQVNHRMY